MNMNEIALFPRAASLIECHADLAMDQVTFRSDTVLSEVHLLLPNACHLMKRLNSVGQPGKESWQTSARLIVCVWNKYYLLQGFYSARMHSI